MILALSTSSPFATVGLFTATGEFVREDAKPIERNASELLIGSAHELLPNFPNGLTSIAVDVGPGSFTGTKVGVTMAKVWAEICGVPLIAWNSFDLVSTEKGVFIPYKPNAFVVRIPGEIPMVDPDAWRDDWVGYGREDRETVRLSWSKVSVLDGVKCSPATLVPQFFVEPSISKPKVAYKGSIT